MTKKTRKVSATYFDFLDWYFTRQTSEPISGNAQALMTHILHLGNDNYGDDFEVTEKFLSVKSNLENRTMHKKLEELVSSGYIEYRVVGDKKISIHIKYRESYIVGQHIDEPSVQNTKVIAIQDKVAVQKLVSDDEFAKL